MGMTIATHVAPDWDAICSVWLLKRYQPGFADADVVFVNTGSPDPAVLESAAAVVDTGRAWDVTTHRYDHHQFPGAMANERCAAKLVYDTLRGFGYIDGVLEPLINLINAGDTGKKEANESRMLGIHALLSNKKRQGADSYSLLAYGFDILDNLAQSLISQDDALKSLVMHTVYRSEDGLVVALKDAPQGATWAAHDAGVRLVVFADYRRNAIGVMRGGEGADVDCGALVGWIVDDPTAPTDLGSELDTWFRHPAGFVALRGSDKAPRDDAILVSLRDVAAALDAAWRR